MPFSESCNSFCRSLLLLGQALGAAILGIALALLLAEGLVQQRALLAHQAAQFLQLVVQRLVLLPWPRLAVLAHAHIFQHGLQHGQKLRRFLAVAGLGQLLDHLEQLLHIVHAQIPWCRATCGVWSGGGGLAASACDVALHRFVVALEQFVDHVLRRARGQRGSQHHLQLAQFLCRRQQAAALQLQRGLPQQVFDPVDVGFALGVLHAVKGAAQRQEDVVLAFDRNAPARWSARPASASRSCGPRHRRWPDAGAVRSGPAPGDR